MKIATVFFCLLILISSINAAAAVNFTPAPITTIIYCPSELPPPPSVFDVYTVEDLRAVDYQSPNIVSIELMNDIEITDEFWKPIGSFSKPFTGEFNGNNHTITFTKDTEFIPAVGSENTGCGLFGYVYDGQIQDLNIVLQGNLTSRENNTGALVGIINLNYSSVLLSSSAPSATIINCNVFGNGYSVSGENNVGGLVGNIVRGSIVNSSSDCSVTAENNAGGLVGFASHGVILNSSASSSVISKEYAGALIGYISNETTISNSSADGAVKPKGAFGNFIGGWAENYKPTVLDCFYQETEVDLEPVPIGNDEKATKTAMAAIMSIVLLAIVIVIIYSKKRN